MCLEVYAPDQAIKIPFAHEQVRLMRPQSVRLRYSLLVANAGRKPINELMLISPFRLLRETGGPGEVELRGLGNIIANLSLPDNHEFFSEIDRGRLRMKLPDPLDPARTVRLDGIYREDNGVWTFPAEMCQEHLIVLAQSPFSAWSLRLHEPIPPGDAQWFWWQVDVEKLGQPLRSSLTGAKVIHHVASPCDVRRSFREWLEASAAEYDEINDPEYAEVCRELLQMFHLHPRRVDVQYFEYRLETGDPRRQMMDLASTEGQIKMRSMSPRIGAHPKYDSECLGEPVFEWRFGSLLDRPRNWRRWLHRRWNAEHFMLRYILTCRPEDLDFRQEPAVQGA
jgi:hypothetical protein